jgi:hypothetical protein
LFKQILISQIVGKYLPNGNCLNERFIHFYKTRIYSPLDDQYDDRRENNLSDIAMETRIKNMLLKDVRDEKTSRLLKSITTSSIKSLVRSKNQFCSWECAKQWSKVNVPLNHRYNTFLFIDLEAGYNVE